MKKVIDNTTGDGPTRQRQAVLQVDYAKAVGPLLHDLAGEPHPDVFVQLDAFLNEHLGNGDLNGVALRKPDLSDTEGNEHINTILRGSLRMVAAMLDMLAKNPTDNPDVDHRTDAKYISARNEIVQGIVLYNRKILDESGRIPVAPPKRKKHSFKRKRMIK